MHFFLKSPLWIAGMCWVAWLACWKSSLWAQFKQHLTCSSLIPRGMSCPFEEILFAHVEDLVEVLSECARPPVPGLVEVEGSCGLTCCSCEGGDCMSISQHSADHSGILGAPAIITYCSPGPLVKDFHAAPPAPFRNSYKGTEVAWQFRGEENSSTGHTGMRKKAR